MKKLISLMLSVIFAFTLSACGGKETTSDTDISSQAQGEAFSAPENYASVLLVTINPQFRLYLDENNNVLAVEPVNDDAKSFSSDIAFENKPIEAVIESIVEKANENGFVKENATVNFEITEQKSKSVNEQDILQKAIDVAEQKATELKIVIVVKTEKTKENTSSESEADGFAESTETSSVAKSSSEMSASKSNTSKATSKNNKSTSSVNKSTATSSNKSDKTKSATTSSAIKSTEAKCNHNIKYIFDNKENAWSHSKKCTICNQNFENNISCEDKNKDNKCDYCLAKMDFETAYNNTELNDCLFMLAPLCDGNGKEVSHLLEQAYSVAAVKNLKNAVRTEEYDVYITYYYSADVFEKTVKSFFNITDSDIAKLRTMYQMRYGIPEEGIKTPIYDSKTNTYSWQDPNRGWSRDLFGYEKISNTEYNVYFNGCYGNSCVKCTYNDTVKITDIKSYDKLPTNLIKFK